MREGHGHRVSRLASDDDHFPFAWTALEAVGAALFWSKKLHSLESWELHILFVRRLRLIIDDKNPIVSLSRFLAIILFNESTFFISKIRDFHIWERVWRFCGLKCLCLENLLENLNSWSLRVTLTEFNLRFTIGCCTEHSLFSLWLPINLNK